MAAFLIISFVACVILQRYSQQLAFFFPATRAWELLAGGLLAAYELRYGALKKTRMTQVAALAGMAAILVSVVLLGHSTHHPGLVTLLPVVGTVLVIACSGNGGLVARVFGAMPLRYVGAISYSLYLWHFPVFAFWRIAYSESFQGVGKFIAVVLVFILSIVTYHFVEQPFRHRKRWPIWKFSIIATAIVGAIAVFLVEKNGFPERLNEVVSPAAMQKEWAAINRFSNYVGEGGKPIVFIMGDSYAKNWSVAMNRYIDHEKFDVVSVSYLGCGVDIESSVAVTAASGAMYKDNCSKFEKYVNDLEMLKRVETVFIVGHRPFEYSANKFKFDVASWVVKHGNNPDVYVFGNYFQLDRNVYDSCLNLMYVKKRDASICLEEANYPPPEGLDIKALPLYPKRFKFRYVDIIELYCDRSKIGCAYEGDGVPFIMDWNHLTVGFLSRIFKEAFERKREKLDNLGLLRFMKDSPNW